MEEVKKFLKQTRVNTLTIIGANGFLGKSIIDYAQNKSLSKWGINKIILISRNKFSIKNSKRITIQYKVGDISKIKRLSQSKFLAGNNYTIADIATFPWIARHEWHDIGLKKFKSLTRWYKEISNRNGVKKGYDLLKRGDKIPKV